MSAEASMIKEIKELKAAYALFSRRTNLPLVECEETEYNDQAFLYAAKEDADQAAEEFKRAGILTEVRKLGSQEALEYLGILPLLGVNALGYTPAGGGPVMAGLQELLPEGFEEQLAKNVFYQPNLQLTGIYFLQEVRKEKEFKDQKRIRELDEEFSANLVRSRLFLAVAPPPGHEKDEKLSLKDCRLPYVKNPEGECLLPIFTDVWEFGKYARKFKEHTRGNQSLRFVQVPFSELEKFPVQEVREYVLNPSGFSLSFKKELIQVLLKRFGAGPA